MIQYRSDFLTTVNQIMNGKWSLKIWTVIYKFKFGFQYLLFAVSLVARVTNSEIDLTQRYMGPSTRGVARDSNPGFEKPGPRGNPAILPNLKPGFKSSWNPGFGFVFFGCIKMLSVHFYSRSCTSLMRFLLVIVHKLSKCLLLLFLPQTD